MRSATILAAALVATLAATPANANKFTFAKPLFDAPSEPAKSNEAPPDAPTIKLPEFDFVIVPQPDAPPGPIHPRLEPHSEEWNCLVPLQGMEPAPEIAPSRCENPSIEPDDLFHLL